MVYHCLIAHVWWIFRTQVVVFLSWKRVVNSMFRFGSLDAIQLYALQQWMGYTSLIYPCTSGYPRQNIYVMLPKNLSLEFSWLITCAAVALCFAATFLITGSCSSCGSELVMSRLPGLPRGEYASNTMPAKKGWGKKNNLIPATSSRPRIIVIRRLVFQHLVIHS